jgi:hypothetical protein
VIVAAQGKVVITMLSPIAFKKDSGGTRIFLLLMAVCQRTTHATHTTHEYS